MEFLVLGPLEVVGDDGSSLGIGGTRRRFVLASLLVRAGEAVSVNEISHNVWGDDVPSNPKSAVQVAVSRLRSTLGADRIQSRGNSYVLRVGPDELDTQMFEGFAAEGQRAAANGQVASAVELYDRALTLWRGAAYDEFVYDDFAQGEIRRLNELRATVVEERLRSMLGLGLHSDALPQIESLLAANQLRENLWALYMLCLYRSGRQADALRAYQRAADTLGDELGIEPSRGLRDLEEQILLQDVRLSRDTPPSTPSPPTGEVTFLIADGGAAAGLGDEAIIAAAFSVFETAVSAAGGYIFRSTADQRFAVFELAALAAGAALDVQLEIADTVLALGVHTTTAHLQAGDYVGLGVSRAVRVAAAAAPGQILMTMAAAAAVEPSLRPEVELRELPPRVLPGLSAPEVVAEMSHPGLKATAIAMVSPTNLPSEQLSSFVGRASELRDVGKLLDDHRLITFTGPGGVGKTRLALQVASDQVGRHTDGVWLVELAAIDTADLIVKSIADVIGVEPNGRPLLEMLRERLSQFSALIVLDNCEHVVDEVAELVADLLHRNEELRIIATSRERLGISGERVFPVPRLAVPTLADSMEPADLEEFEAVQLFAARARMLDSMFAVGPDNAPSIVRICRRVDGIPLAIELAAAQIGFLHAQEIAARLDEGFQLLDTGRRRGRQETLHAAIDWSYQLLGEAERQVLASTSVFEGGFDMDAAEAVCAEVVSEQPIVAFIAGLVRKSLVVTRPSGSKTRYELLQTIRSFARATLEPGSWLTLEGAHAAFFAEMVTTEDSRVEGAEAADALARLRRNADNLRVALNWFTQHDPAAGIVLVPHLGFLIKLGLAAEGVQLAENMFAAYRGNETTEFANAKKVAGALAYTVGEVDRALDWWDDSARVAHQLGDALGYARTVNNMAILTMTAIGSLADGAALFRQAYQALPDDAESWLAVSIIGNLAMAEFKLGNLETALADMETHHRLAQQAKLRTGEAMALGNMGLALWCMGRLDEAEPKLVESIAISREVGDSEFLSEPLKVLAEVYIATGRWTAATGPAAEALELRIGVGRVDVPDFIETIGSLAVASGEHRLGVRLVGAARTAKSRPSADPVTPEEVARQQVLIDARDTLGAAFATAWDEGSMLSEADAVALAQEVIGSASQTSQA